MKNDIIKKSFETIGTIMCVIVLLFLIFPFNELCFTGDDASLKHPSETVSQNSESSESIDKDPIAEMFGLSSIGDSVSTTIDKPRRETRQAPERSRWLMKAYDIQQWMRRVAGIYRLFM